MFSKKRILLALIFVFLILVSLVVYISYKNSSETKVVPQTTGVQYKDLTPGVSTEEIVVAALGNTVKEKQEGNTKILEYQSNNPNFNNQFSLNSGTLSFVKQIVTLDENITISDINKKYGNYKEILYGPTSTSGFDLFVYPDKGLAYIGHQQSGIILEIWYFPPTDIETFKNLYAKVYSDTLQPVQ